MSKIDRKTQPPFQRLFFVLLATVVAGSALVLAACAARTAEPAAPVATADATAALASIPPEATSTITLPSPVVEAGSTAVPVVASGVEPPPSPTPAPTVFVEKPPTPPVTPLAEAAAPTTAPVPEASPTSEPLPTPPGAYSWTLKVPILMYHYVSTPPEDADIYRVDLSVTPEQFREQMTYLRDNGYTTVDFYDLSLAISNQRPLPDKPIILTFDDGYLDNYEVAFPILNEFGQKGVFFVVTEFIDKGRAEYVTWDMVKEMAAAGMRVESHSRTHPDLRTKSRDGLIWEILGSQETIGAHIGYTPRYFAYPGGDYDEETINVLRDLDFWGAVTTVNGTWHGFDDRYEWRRVRVRNTTTLEEFSRLVDLEGTVGGKLPEG